jgi:hypothetical protein
VAPWPGIVSIAAFNRVKLRPRRLTADGDRDDTSQAALERLWRNVIAEMCLGAIIIAIVGGLGTTPPSFHKHGPAQHHMHAGEANHTEPGSRSRQRWADAWITWRELLPLLPRCLFAVVGG